MNYSKHYNALIDRAKVRTLGGYYERHHIVPKCLGGTDDFTNIVNLLPEEHLVAHLLLCKMHQSHRGLAAAAMFLTSMGRASNKKYGWLKRRMAETMSGENHHLRKNENARLANQKYMRSDRNPQRANPRCGERHHFFGKKNPFEWTKESREKIAVSKRGRKNPMFELPPWQNPASTGEALKMWSRADEVLAVHLANPTWGYSRISRAMNLDAPHRCQGILHKIKNGWNPLLDDIWLSWKNGQKNE